MRRREFITLLGGAASAWPLGARAQSAMPVIGFLNGVSFEGYADQAAAIKQGLKDSGFVEEQNVKIEYRSADGRAELLPALATDLVNRQVSAIVAIGTSTPALAAKNATTTIPIIFAMGGDAVDVGLVTNLRRPEGNITGMSLASTQLAPKRLELLRELIPDVSSIGYFVNRRLSPSADSSAQELAAAAVAMGREIVVLDTHTDEDIDKAFTNVKHRGLGAIIVMPDAFLTTRRDTIVALAAAQRVPAIYSLRSIVVGGGLMSYGVASRDMYRQAGIYIGRILKGEKPSDLPVMQPTKFELVINLKTARALGLEVPPTLLARADEVIE